MSPRIAKRLAWSLFALALVLSISAVLLVIAFDSAVTAPHTRLPPAIVQGMHLSALDWILDWIEGVMGVVPLLAFSALGALIVSRYPTHAIGWIFCALGPLGAVEPFAVYYAIFALFVAPNTLPGGVMAAWLQNWIWVVSIVLICAFLPLLFPTGRLVSKRWKPAWWLAISTTVALVLERALHPGRLGNYLGAYDIPNPLGVAPLDALRVVFFTLPLDLLHASMLVAAASLVVRLRHARGHERQQIKWFAYFGAAVGGLEVLGHISSIMPGVSTPFFMEWAYPLAWPIALTGLALGAGLAILRYRLYDIDVIIRRTLVYGTLTALLAGVYLTLVIGLGSFARTVFGLSEQQPLIVVGSTLAVFALVQPLRRGIQRFIDRRFYRSKYDAARTLAAFGATLRTETDLSALSERLIVAVQETMHPAHVSLWLRASPQATSSARLTTGDAPGSRRQSGDVRAV
ncbi:MAG TPA: hypothetical protein VH591_03765 [Ktedonobacterales bacterium]|jgi:hypothetical protein